MYFPHLTRFGATSSLHFLAPRNAEDQSACSTVALSTPPAKIMIDQSQSLIGSRSDRWLEYIKGAPNLAFILATTHHHERSSRCTQQLQLGLFILSSRVTPLVVVLCHVFLHLVFTSASLSLCFFLPHCKLRGPWQGKSPRPVSKSRSRAEASQALSTLVFGFLTTSIQASVSSIL